MRSKTHEPRSFTLAEAQARAIVANPTPAQSPFLRRLAWCSLKQARDQAVIQSRLPRAPRPDGPDSPRAA